MVGRLRLLPQYQREGAALAIKASERYVAPERTGKAATQMEPEARAGGIYVRVQLRERLKELFMIFRPDADAGIDDVDAGDRSIAPWRALDHNPHRSGGRELDAVIGQIQQYLNESAAAAAAQGVSWRAIDLQRQAFAFGEGTQ